MGRWSTELDSSEHLHREVVAHVLPWRDRLLSGCCVAVQGRSLLLTAESEAGPRGFRHNTFVASSADPPSVLRSSLLGDLYLLLVECDPAQWSACLSAARQLSGVIGDRRVHEHAGRAYARPRAALQLVPGASADYARALMTTHAIVGELFAEGGSEWTGLVDELEHLVERSRHLDHG